jgi:hypothetical protein
VREGLAHDLVGAQAPEVLRPGVPDQDLALRVHHHDPRPHAAEDGAEEVVGLLQLARALAQLVVEGLQLLVGRLQLLLGGLQLLVGGLQLLVGPLQLLLEAAVAGDFDERVADPERGAAVVLEGLDLEVEGLEAMRASPSLAKLAGCLAQAEGVVDWARIVQGDIFKEDFSRASVVTMYLLPHLNLCVRHRILAMAPGTRVVSHQYSMADSDPDRSRSRDWRDRRLRGHGPRQRDRRRPVDRHHGKSGRGGGPAARRAGSQFDSRTRGVRSLTTERPHGRIVGNDAH